MSESWLAAITPTLVAIALLLVPGALVIFAGWGRRRPELFALSPAISAAMLGLAAVGAPLIGVRWSWMPLALLTVIGCATSFAFGRWQRESTMTRYDWRGIGLITGALLVSAVVIALQLKFVFITPDSISQTFDAIVHLNSVQFAIETQNASAFSIGRTSDISFYPNAWHSLASLTAMTSGASVPVAVNASNIAIGAVAWPTSMAALTAALFPGRAAAIVISAGLSTGFGAFPILLFDFGVLYPNAMAYALLPAGIASVIWTLGASGRAALIRAGVLLLVVTGGIGLAHPNAMLALYAIGLTLTIVKFGADLRLRPSKRGIVTRVAIVLVLAVGLVAVWAYARTPYGMSRWGAWQSPAQALGEAILGSPRGYPVTLLTAGLIILGFLAIVRRPGRWMTVLVPFAIAALFFVLASGVSSGNPLREAVTNPWYNDPYRLAALLPLACIPIATLGALAIVNAAADYLAHRRLSRLLSPLLSALALVALFCVALGPNVTRTAEQARGAYVMDGSSRLLTDSEARLLERVDQAIPDDALIVGSPWTGASLAYALTGRQVMELHIFGQRSPGELYLDEHLADIDTDPRVCDAIRELGVDYVLDFGKANVVGDPGSATDWDGIQSIPPAQGLIVVDSEGPDARLLQVSGCAK